jgi:hypothetical protein
MATSTHERVQRAQAEIADCELRAEALMAVITTAERSLMAQAARVREAKWDDHVREGDAGAADYFRARCGVRRARGSMLGWARVYGSSMDRVNVVPLVGARSSSCGCAGLPFF